ATATATGVTFTANSPVQLSAGGNIQLGRIDLGTGPGIGQPAFIVTPGGGSNITESAGANSGITQTPLVGAGSFTMQQGRIDATFTGNTTSGSTTVSSVSSVAHLVVGQTVAGPGIAPGTTMTAIGTTTITLSQAATASGVGVTLTAGVSEIQSLSFSALTGNFAIAFNGAETTLLAAGASAAAVQSALVSLPGIGPGNVVVTGAAGNYIVKFQGAFANTNVQPLSLVSAGNIVLNTTGNISLNNPNNNWTGLIDINAATPGGLTLNNISSINLLGTPAFTGAVSLTSGHYITVPNLAYTLNRFTANAKETAVQQNITTTGNAITFVGTASLGVAGTLLTVNSGGFATNFTGDVFVNTTTGGLTFSSTTGAVNFNQGTWHEGSSPLNITGSGNFNVGGGTTPATFNMVSGTITMGGGVVNVSKFSAFQDCDTNVTNTGGTGDL